MGSFLLMMIWCEGIRDMAAIFCLKLLSVWWGSTNLRSVFSVEWFLVVRKPLVDTSKQDTVHFYPVQSVMKCAYFFFLFLSANIQCWPHSLRLTGICELEQMDLFPLLVYNNYIWFVYSYTKFRGN